MHQKIKTAILEKIPSLCLPETPQDLELLKKECKRVHKMLTADKIEVKLSDIHNTVANKFGYGCWQALKAKAEKSVKV